jgi:glycosyltransferase involved in cell wall biosynthesis
MRIAFLSPFYPYRGGIAQPSALLYRELEKEHEVKAFTFTRQYPGILFPGSNQYVTEKDNADKIPAVRCLDTVNPFSWKPAANKVREFKPDLFLSAFWMPFFAPSYGAVSKRVRKDAKVISILHNVIPHEHRIGDKALLKYFLKQNDGFAVMSESVRNDLLELQPGAQYFFHELPLYDHYGKLMDQETAKKSLQIPSDKKVLLFFGFIRDYKGLDLLIDAVAKLDDSYVLVIAGEVYGSFDKYQKQIDALNINHRIIKHVRYIDDAEVPLFFSAADVCVLPYKGATQSGVTSIAWHFNVPVIATDVGGLKESIQHRNTGLIADEPEADTIAILIKRYFAENVKGKFVSNIIELKNKLSWSHYAKGLLDFAAKL